MSQTQTQSQTKVDIISSVFNCDQFLEGFFADIVRQTYFQYCHLILVAPKPSQKLTELFNEYRQKYENLTLIKLEEDPGISACLNLAIQAGSSPYINIANTDDRKRIDSIEKCVLTLDANPGVDLVYGLSLITSKPNEIFESTTGRRPFPCHDFNGIAGLLSCNSPHNNPMWRRSMNEKNGLFDESLQFCADLELWLRCAQNGSVFKKINEPLGIYYHNPRGKSTDSRLTPQKSVEEGMVKERYRHAQKLVNTTTKSGKENTVCIIHK